MASWTVYPAIDLRNGRCVRLLRGDPAAETVFSDHPVDVARRWAGRGAQALHVVDLDGALQGAPAQLALLEAIAGAVSVPVQYGGGLRTLDDVARAFAAGAARVIIGTAAQDPSFFAELVRRWGPERVVAGLDARGTNLAVAGWVTDSGRDVLAVAHEVRAAGATQALYTQVERDGTLEGPDLTGLRRLLSAGIGVIASGGVHSLEDIRLLAAMAPMGVTGVVVGRALYTGAVDLRQAVEAAAGGQG